MDGNTQACSIYQRLPSQYGRLWSPTKTRVEADMSKKQGKEREGSVPSPPPSSTFAELKCSLANHRFSPISGVVGVTL